MRCKTTTRSHRSNRCCTELQAQHLQPLSLSLSLFLSLPFIAPLISLIVSCTFALSRSLLSSFLPPSLSSRYLLCFPSPYSASVSLCFSLFVFVVPSAQLNFTLSGLPPPSHPQPSPWPISCTLMISPAHSPRPSQPFPSSHHTTPARSHLCLPLPAARLPPRSLLTSPHSTAALPGSSPSPSVCPSVRVCCRCLSLVRWSLGLALFAGVGPPRHRRCMHMHSSTLPSLSQETAYTDHSQCLQHELQAQLVSARYRSRAEELDIERSRCQVM